jgi:thiamine biosynthesis lipoprotein ApbE
MSANSNSLILSNAKTVMATRLEMKVLFPENYSEEEISSIENHLASGFHLAERIEAAVTEYRESSPVFQLNHAKPTEWIEGNEDLFFLLGRSAEFSIRTEGAFDPGFRGNRELPFSERWERSTDGKKIRRKSEEFLLGFGAIGKGYAVDKMSGELNRRLSFPFLINFGGSSLYFSENTAGTELARMGWAWEKDISGEYVGVELHRRDRGEISVGVSGTLEKGSHISSGRQNDATSGNVLSAFCSGKSALECDAFSTALFVLDWDQGYSKRSSFPLEAGLSLVHQDRVPFWDENFSKQWISPFGESAE